MVVTSPAPGEEGAKARHSRGTNPDVPTVCNGDGVPVPGSRSNGLNCGKGLSRIAFCIISAIFRGKYDSKFRC